MHRILASLSCIALILISLTGIGCKTTPSSKIPHVSKTTPVQLSTDNPQNTNTHENFAQQNQPSDDSTTVDPQPTTTQEAKEADNPALLNEDSKRVVLSWASDTLIRAQSILHGSDDLPLLIEAAMDSRQKYRKTLAEHLNHAGVSETQCDQTLAKVEDHIRTMTRDFILKARTLLKRQSPSPHPKPQATDQLLT